MAPIQAAKVDAVASTIASVRKEGSHDINMHLPTKEQPILRALFEFRHSLNALRKNSHGAVTLADMNAKATELAAIMMQMKNARANEYDLDIPRNRVDDLLDTVWMNMFSMWAKIEAVNETIYPTYVSLVTLSRTADALRASCSWTPADVQPLQERLNLLDETVAASEGKFLNTSSGSSTIPHGQAVMASLLNRVHRTVSFLVSENSTSGRFDELKDELEGLLEELDVFEANKFEINELIPVSKRLHEIESRLGTNNTEPGFATVSGMLNMCLNKLADLVADLDPVTESSPLFSAFKALSEADQELSNLLDNTDFRQDTEFTHSSIARIQNRLQELEKQRVNGTFVPLSFSFEDAVKLPGQGAMHKILHQCHSKLFRLLEPASEPIVGEKLMEVYEQLMKNRSTLRRLRAYASAGWNVASDLDIITQEQQAVEARLAKAGTADSDDDAEFGRLLGSRSNALSTGMGAVWALLDECDSLLWNTRCAIVAATATKFDAYFITKYYPQARFIPSQMSRLFGLFGKVGSSGVRPGPVYIDQRFTQSLGFPDNIEFADEASDPCSTCTAPCAEGHAVYPTAISSSIDKGPMINSVKPYSRHLMFCAGSGDEWPSHIEEGNGPKSFLNMLDAGLGAGNARLKQTGVSGGRTMVSAIDRNPEGNSDGSEHVNTVERTEVFFFPEFKAVRGVSSDEISKIVENWVATKSLEPYAEDIEYDALIFVCTHKKRDKRCGVSGPLLVNEFNNVISELGLTEKVSCIGISHIGGHKFAGNLIVYSRKFPQGVWYGRVNPCHVENIVKKTVVEGKVFKDLYRDDEILSDAFKIKEVDDFLLEVDCEMVKVKEGADVDIGANASAEGGEDDDVQDGEIIVNNVVYSFRLQSSGFDKDGYKTYIKGYMKALKNHLVSTKSSRAEDFEKKAAAAVRKVLTNFSDYDFYVGESMNPDGMVILLNYREDGTTPYLTLWKDGLRATKV